MPDRFVKGGKGGIKIVKTAAQSVTFLSQYSVNRNEWMAETTTWAANRNLLAGTTERFSKSICFDSAIIQIASSADQDSNSPLRRLGSLLRRDGVLTNDRRLNQFRKTGNMNNIDHRENSDDPNQPNSVSNKAKTEMADSAEWLAKPMFGLSIVFLMLLAGLVVAWVDILPDTPTETLEASSVSNNSSSIQNDWQQPALQSGYLILQTLIAIWPLFLLEPLYFCWMASRGNCSFKLSKADWWCALCPPLRLGKAIAAKNNKIWLPGMGWRTPGKTFQNQLERVFSKPMLVIAMMILPVLVIEFCFQDMLKSTAWLKLLLSISMGLIWCAFTIEFILMVSATHKKLAYVKKNWIDLAIILLPLISFLRSLRIVRAAKVAKFAKVQQLTKMGRVYRMRGLIAKTVRAFLVLELVHRILRTSPEKRLEKLLTQVEEKEEELRELQQQVATVRAKIQQQDDHPSDGSPPEKEVSTTLFDGSPRSEVA